MPTKCCAVPGCRGRFGVENVRSTFTIRRVDLAKNDAERQHRSQLRRFILSVRDAKHKDDSILSQLQKESACICDRHFLREDIINIGNHRRHLKVGAVPCLYLPKPSKVFCVPKRKTPMERKAARDLARIKKEQGQQEASHDKKITTQPCPVALDHGTIIPLPDFSLQDISATSFNHEMRQRSIGTGIDTQELVTSKDFSCQVGSSYLFMR